jgi:hypothetical protein
MIQSKIKSGVRDKLGNSAFRKALVTCSRSSLGIACFLLRALACSKGISSAWAIAVASSHLISILFSTILVSLMTEMHW